MSACTFPLSQTMFPHFHPIPLFDMTLICIAPHPVWLLSAPGIHTKTLLTTPYGHLLRQGRTLLAPFDFASITSHMATFTHQGQTCLCILQPCPMICHLLQSCAPTPWNPHHVAFSCLLHLLSMGMSLTILSSSCIQSCSLATPNQHHSRQIHLCCQSQWWLHHYCQTSPHAP